MDELTKDKLRVSGRERWKLLGEDEKARMATRLSEAMSARWDALSDEAKAEQVSKLNGGRLSRKLSDAQVRLIRASQLGCVRLSRQFYVSVTTIYRIRQGSTYRDVA